MLCNPRQNTMFNFHDFCSCNCYYKIKKSIAKENAKLATLYFSFEIIINFAYHVILDKQTNETMRKNSQSNYHKINDLVAYIMNRDEMAGNCFLSNKTMYICSAILFTSGTRTRYVNWIKISRVLIGF